MFWLYLLALLSAFGVHRSNAQYFENPSRRCINPNQRPGTCVSIYDCQTLLSVLQRGALQPLDAQFMRASECSGGYGNGPHVCCTGDTGYTRPPADGTGRGESTVLFPTNEQPRQRKRGGSGGGKQARATADNFGGDAGGLLPRPPNCGGVTISNKIYSGSDTDLFEFPWMVLLEYNRRAGGVSSSCAGSLINQRYVVTAAHCVKGAIEQQVGSLAAVRLGEHDQSSNVDCDEYSCSSGTERVGIEDIIVHEQYRDESANKEHDIALVRLDRDIRFSRAVRPICLPSALPAPRQQLTSESRLTVAGWGRTLNSARSAIKQKLQLPFVEQEQCQRQYLQRRVNIADTQLCAGGEFARDSCDGDSGGPLMQFRNDAWVLEGIVSFGYKCGLRGWPGVYTRVALYDNWIRSKVRN